MTKLYSLEFYGEERESTVNGLKEHYFAHSRRSQRIALSMMVVGSLLLLVAGTVMGIYLLRYTLEPMSGHNLSQLTASVLNAIIIHLLNRVYFQFCSELTEWENHRTQTEVM